MKRCAIYARYSSDLQSPTSIDDQLQLCRAYADRQGWAIITTFRDAALSGFGVEQRPGYQQLVAAVGATPPGFDTILVEDLSRLTRDTGELLRLYHRLRLKGIDSGGAHVAYAPKQSSKAMTPGPPSLRARWSASRVKPATSAGFSRRGRLASRSR
jgi:hypothetical protein